MRFIKNIFNYFKSLNDGRKVLKNIDKEIAQHENNLFIYKRYQLDKERYFEEKVIKLL